MLLPLMTNGPIIPRDMAGMTFWDSSSPTYNVVLSRNTQILPHPGIFYRTIYLKVKASVRVRASVVVSPG